ncbi:hypothetical protein JJB11_03605 [Ramlibacter ginsenosidimutans]|uniref:Class I SAM-dependent methyltransferase n=1 Tax=Ramlibacter ginsenosidimutans TaxID=502333 RepID=A0A934TR41_9BURK|nr:hypothetical protein [Ramlibacter ginsenosidimutans]MBK6005167.1 hypothetical protein [Ramlibacter ginsenosidimutans]
MQPHNTLLTRIRSRIGKRLLGEERWVAKSGDLRMRERHGVVARPNYAYGMLRAADVAKYFGKQSVTVVEFGVASGHGLLNMIELAELIEGETGVEFRVFGFDTGAGLPELIGYRDHPELWRGGDFAMEDRDALMRKIAGRADIVWGDIADTVGAFTDALTADAPLGFVSVDVDIYTATKSALRCLKGPSQAYLPAVSMYFDDVTFFFANRWAGELAAIEEFNMEHDLRKIDVDRSLPGSRRASSAPWYRHMYACHVLDHDARQRVRQRAELPIGAHHQFMSNQFLY